MTYFRAIVDNPVLLRELRGRIRLRKLTGRAWKVVGSCLLLIILRYYYLGIHGISHGRVDDARDLWQDLSYFLLGLVCLFSPAFSATAISQEREQQTWDLLQVTRLSGVQVILGKWLARQTISWGVILVLMPLIVAAALHSNAGWLGAIENLAYVALNCAFWSALGLFCSSIVRRTPSATVMALVSMAVVCAGTPIIDSIISGMTAHATNYGQSIGSYTMWVNPIYVLSIIDGQISDPPTAPSMAAVMRHVVETSVFVEAGLTVLFLSLMIRSYRRLASI